MRSIQFKHERLHDCKGNLLPKGGRTICLETPNLEEFKAFKPSLSQGVVFKLGIAYCSAKDHYNKKIGREISKGRLKDTNFFVTLTSSDEVQIMGGGITAILRKAENSDRVYFEEVV